MELTSFSATTLARFIRTNLVSSVAVVDAHLARLEAVNPKLNAVVQLQAEAARQQARAADEAISRGERLGPLHGVPITLKDSLDTADMVSTWGTTGRAGFTPEHDATVVGIIRLTSQTTAWLASDGGPDSAVSQRRTRPARPAEGWHPA